MHTLAHHAGEQALAPLLLLFGGGGISLLLAIGRARLAALRSLRSGRPTGRRRRNLERNEPGGGG